MDQAVSIAARRVDLAQAAPFALGPAAIDPAAHEAVIGSRREHFQPQTMKVLVALHQRLGEVVSRDELVERCWDGRIVGDDVINRCISLLRRVAARAGDDRFVRRRIYCRGPQRERLGMREFDAAHPQRNRSVHPQPPPATISEIRKKSAFGHRVRSAGRTALARPALA